MLFHLFTAVIGLYILPAVALHAAASTSQSFCNSVTSSVAAHHEKSEATAYCSSFLSVRAKTSTIVATQTSVLTITTTTTSTEDYYTATIMPTVTGTITVTSGTSTYTTTVTTTPILVNPTYSCVVSGTTAERAAAESKPSSPFPSTWKNRKISSACECFTITPSTSLVTKSTTVTTTTTKTATSITTSYDTQTLDTYTYTFVTSPYPVFATTTITAAPVSANTDVPLRISLSYTNVASYNEPLYMFPYPLGLGKGGQEVDIAAGLPLNPDSPSDAQWVLDEDCNLINTAEHRYVTAEDSKGLLYLYASNNTMKAGRERITCQVDLGTSETLCQNPFGGNTTFLCTTYYIGSAREYYLIADGDTNPDYSGSPCGIGSMYAVFEE